jgi:hypothetical protein
MITPDLGEVETQTRNSSSKKRPKRRQSISTVTTGAGRGQFQRMGSSKVNIAMRMNSSEQLTGGEPPDNSSRGSPPANGSGSDNDSRDYGLDAAEIDKRVSRLPLKASGEGGGSMKQSGMPRGNLGTTPTTTGAVQHNFDRRGSAPHAHRSDVIVPVELLINIKSFHDDDNDNNIGLVLTLAQRRFNSTMEVPHFDYRSNGLTHNWPVDREGQIFDDDGEAVGNYSVSRVKLEGEIAPLYQCKSFESFSPLHRLPFAYSCCIHQSGSGSVY